MELLYGRRIGFLLDYAVFSLGRPSICACSLSLERVRDKRAETGEECEVKRKICVLLGLVHNPLLVLLSVISASPVNQLLAIEVG